MKDYYMNIKLEVKKETIKEIRALTFQGEPEIEGMIFIILENSK